MIQNLKIVFIHGNGGGTGQGHWFPWLKKELEALHHPIVSPDFPDSQVAHQNIWLPFMKDDLKIDKNTIIIGHSSGAVAAMRYAEQNQIFGSILVGACYTDLDDATEKLSGYYDHPWNWQSIKNNQNWIIQFHSLDDPYIPINEARFIHQHLNSEYYEFSNRQHFGGEGVNDQKTFPELFEALTTKLLK